MGGSRLSVEQASFGLNRYIEFATRFLKPDASRYPTATAQLHKFNDAGITEGIAVNEPGSGVDPNW